MRLAAVARVLTFIVGAGALTVMTGEVRPTLASPDPATLRVAFASTPNTLNPVIRTITTESLVISAIFDGLVQATVDGKILPVLAAAVPTVANGGISRDGRTITYHLRHGVRWHDGVPFTSRDVAFTQAAFSNPNNNVTVKDPFRSVVRLETPDDFTVVVHLAQPYAPFVAEWFASSSLGIVPAHLLAGQKELNDIPFDAAPVGTGPFVFDRWERGREIVLRANDNYFLGRPKLRRIVFTIMDAENTRNIALRTGETDWSFQAAPTSLREMSGVPGIQTVQLATNAFTGVRLQTVRPPLDDIRLRHAIAAAIDRAALVQKIVGAGTPAATSDIGPDDWAYDPAIEPLPFDPALSRRLLASAGWRPGADGIVERDGKRLALVFVYPAGQPVAEAFAVQIEAALRVAGIAVDLKPEQANLMFAPAGQHGTLAAGSFDLEFSGFYNTADPNDRRSFACASVPPNGFNFSRWCDAEYDRVTNDALLHVDRARRKGDYARASRRLIDGVPELFLYWPKNNMLLRSGVRIDDGDRNLALPYLWSAG